MAGRTLPRPMSRSRPDRRRSQASWLAPLALITCIALTALIVTSRNPDGSARSGAGSPGKQAKKSGRKSYTVRSGDTLTSISLRYDVPVDRIQDLNPEIDTLSLQPGARLKLRVSAN